MQKIRERMRSYRKAADISQKQMAHHLGLKQVTYSAMERGQQKIATDYLLKIADVLRVKIWALFAEPDEILESNKTTKILFDTWNRFNQAQQNALLQVIEQMDHNKH